MLATANQPGGCLSAILKLLGLDLAQGDRPGASWPYRRRDDFLSVSERSFFGVLQSAVAGRAYLLAKVRVADLLYVPRGAGGRNWRHWVRKDSGNRGGLHD
jgi:hypothetical protein